MMGRIRRLLDDCVPGTFADASSAAAATQSSGGGGGGGASAEVIGGGGGGGGGGASAVNGVPASSAHAPAPAPVSQQRHRKRKERHESCGSAQERKVVRSNSEERPLENGISRSKESIRRVSSHEDFSSVRTNNKHHHKSKHHHHHHHNNKVEDSEGVCMTLGDGDSSSTSGNTNSSSAPTTITTTTTVANNNKSFLSEVIDTNMGHGVRMAGLPLHERNESQSLSEHYMQQHGSAEREDEDLTEENEHERRRSSERFARAAGMSRGRRNIGRRRRPTHPKASTQVSSTAEDTDGGSSSKENEDQDCNLSKSPHQLQTALSSDEEGNSSRSSSSHSFLQLHPQDQERIPSPEPSPGIVGGPPPLDLTTLHQQVGGAEPLPSRATWSREGGEHEEMIANSRVMLSPRNSLILSRRVYLDTDVPPSPPHERDGVAVQVAQARLKQLGKQMSSMKKKLKRLEEEFEKEYGYRPSHAEKATNKDMKKLCAEMSKARKEMKQLKEDPHNADIHISGEENDKNCPVSTGRSTALTMEDALQEVEHLLVEKRKQAGRPELLDELTREQLLDEKIAVQKGLLHLEDMYGRPVTKGDRDRVRPLYDRYRMLKRMVIRTAPSKMKDSISELATIHEHETMDFTSSPPPSLTTAEDGDSQDSNIAAAAAAAAVASGPPPSMCLSESSEALWKNLHSLSLSELLSQQRSTREEKKRLRRSLRDFEEDFQRRTGKKLQREDRLPMEGIYSSYKQAKAKLRLLDALVSKVSS